MLLDITPDTINMSDNIVELEEAEQYIIDKKTYGGSRLNLDYLLQLIRDRLDEVCDEESITAIEQSSFI